MALEAVVSPGSMNTLLAALLGIVPVILSLTVHEYAHAFAAKKLGDRTAESEGRLTLNPVAHIDPFGTLLLPILLATQGLPAFGWAKPVPTNPLLYTRKITMWKGEMLVAAAGPVSNLLLAIGCTAIGAIFVHSGAYMLVPQVLWTLLAHLIITNIALFVFNMFPVGPLDGRAVLTGLLPPAAAERFYNVSMRYGWIGLVLLVLFAGHLLAFPVSIITRGLWALVGI